MQKVGEMLLPVVALPPLCLLVSDFGDVSFDEERVNESNRCRRMRHLGTQHAKRTGVRRMSPYFASLLLKAQTKKKTSEKPAPSPAPLCLGIAERMNAAGK
jgi:hypothetical protein